MNDGGQPVGSAQRRSVLRNPVQLGLDRVSAFMSSAEVASFIENQDRRVIEYPASDGDSLFFAATV